MASGEFHVALLRGINLGANNKLPMRDLVAMFEAAGCAEVRNYIQSGNIVFRAKPSLATRIPTRIAKHIADDFGYRVPVTLRTAGEILAASLENPFLAQGTEAKSLHVVFLADPPSEARVAGLDPNRSPPDTFIARGREIYMCCPTGLAKSKLTNAYFDSKLATTSTIRNWRTVLELVAMTRG